MRRRLALVLVLSACSSSGSGSTDSITTPPDGGTTTGGDGGTTTGPDGSVPGGPGSLGDVTALGAGFQQACILDAQQDATCWTQLASATPTKKPITGLPPVASLAVGDAFACALTTSGDVYCWGDNSSAQLGHAAGTQGDTTCSSKACSLVPVKVAGLPSAATAISIPVQRQRACVVVADGSLYCWGELLFPDASLTTVACGTSFSQCLTSPTKMTGISGLTDLSVGYDHLCGAAAGGLVCWGGNDFWQITRTTCATGLGPDTGGTCKTSIARADLGALAQRAGTYTNATCVRAQSGDVSCFGRNDVGQLGHAPGTNGDVHNNTVTNIWQNGTALALPALAGARALATSGDFASCAIAKDGSVVCWGISEYGELGHTPGTAGDTTCGGLKCNPTPSVVPGPTDAKLIAVGDKTACALDGAGALWCWGLNFLPTRVAP